jgi:hypothetical protein
MMSAPIVSFTNHLDTSVIVYDSFSNQDNTTQTSANYFGTLTSLATVSAKTTVKVQLIHRTSVLIVENVTTNAPLARLISSPILSKRPLEVTQADVDAMAQTMKFIAFILQNPNDPLTLTFNALWKDTSKPQSTSINQFFTQNPTYAKCTFITYILGISYAGEQPASKSKPLDQAVYSLSSLATLLGGSWPSGFPDIVVTNFNCDTQNDVLAIKATIDVDKLPAQSDEALQFFGSLFSVKQFLIGISFNYGFSAGVLGTRLSISLDAMHVPFGGSANLTINKPTATIDINPLFMFVVFTVKGSIPFSIFGKTFEADVSMVIDNVEAEFGVVIKGDNTSLPAPPVMQGVHFDAFGVGIGIIFEPPGAAIGLQGQLHIGNPATGTLQALNDDTFVVVCQLIEELPNPLYVSFYVPQMLLTDVLTVFTNATTPLDLPVSFTDLSFKWAENPLEPVALPDGSLSNMGYGFSAAANILGLSFYGDIEIDLNNGLTADIEMIPLSLGSIFSIGGDGTGVSIKVDANGNPIKNNQLPTKAAQQQTLKDATTKQLVPPGGPVLKIQTFASPFLHLNGSLSLFELVNQQLEADITSSGLNFEVSYGTPLTTTIGCTLSDFHNLAAAFSFGVDETISLPSIAGVSLGSFLLQTLVNAHFTLNTSLSDIVLKVGGSFDFEGIARNFGDFTADANIQRVTDLLKSIISFIEQDAEQLFNDLIDTGAVWAGKVKQGVITAAGSVASVLKNAYNQNAVQVASTMESVGYSAEQVAGELKQVFDPDQVADALKNAFNESEQGVANAMQQAGYAGTEVAGALKSTFGDDAGQIATALKGAYGWSADQVGDALKSIGYSADQVGNAFKSLGGDFASAGGKILGALSNCLVM